ARQARQELRVRLVPRVAHHGVGKHFELRLLAVDQQVRGRAGGRQLLVVRHILPVVAEALGGERMAVGPAVPLAQLEREDAAFLHLEALEQVGHQVQVAVVADQARVAVDHQQARIAAAADEAVQRAAVLSGVFYVDHQRRLRQALLERRQLSGGDLEPEHWWLSGLRKDRSGKKKKKPRQHPHVSALTRCPLPMSCICGRESSAIRNSLGHAAGSEALPSISASKSSLCARSGSGTAASSALVYGCTGLRNNSAAGATSTMRPAHITAMRSAR